jgi:hypothetical protein
VLNTAARVASTREDGDRCDHTIELRGRDVLKHRAVTQWTTVGRRPRSRETRGKSRKVYSSHVRSGPVRPTAFGTDPCESRQPPQQGNPTHHSLGGRQAVLPAKILARSEPNRATVRQVETLAAQSRQALRRGRLQCHRPDTQHHHISRMPKLLHQRRI